MRVFFILSSMKKGGASSMRAFCTYGSILFSGIGAYMGFLLGGWDGFLYTLLFFVAMDYITGVMVAIVRRKLSSQVGFRGIFKKVSIFILVGVAHMCDTQLIGGGSAVRTAVIFFYLFNEGISILENASAIGLPIPQKLKEALGQLRDVGKEKST